MSVCTSSIRGRGPAWSRGPGGYCPNVSASLGAARSRTQAPEALSSHLSPGAVEGDCQLRSSASGVLARERVEHYTFDDVHVHPLTVAEAELDRRRPVRDGSCHERVAAGVQHPERELRLQALRQAAPAAGTVLEADPVAARRGISPSGPICATAVTS